ncbi:hypothetical protein BDV39DRAFT_170006 [Aspergillus sergii]|uniref:Secreted protein n=1 Tax=Aspergillus sergii TaxID=1034303 RepID=A0A5N6XDG7_9EURO|nr:hypothetical protein BDV39DRAFT_170006 [Aspergillus sergii]
MARPIEPRFPFFSPIYFFLFFFPLLPLDTLPPFHPVQKQSAGCLGVSSTARLTTKYPWYTTGRVGGCDYERENGQSANLLVLRTQSGLSIRLVEQNSLIHGTP